MEQQVRQPVWRVDRGLCVLIVIRCSPQRQRDAEVERVRLAATMEAEGRWVVFDVRCVMQLSVVAQTRGGSSAAEVEGAESGATAVHVSHKHAIATPQLQAAVNAVSNPGALVLSTCSSCRIGNRNTRCRALLQCHANRTKTSEKKTFGSNALYSFSSFVALMNACPVFHHQPGFLPSFID